MVIATRSSRRSGRWKFGPRPPSRASRTPRPSGRWRCGRRTASARSRASRSARSRRPVSRRVTAWRSPRGSLERVFLAGVLFILVPFSAGSARTPRFRRRLAAAESTCPDLGSKPQRAEAPSPVGSRRSRGANIGPPVPIPFAATLPSPLERRSAAVRQPTPRMGVANGPTGGWRGLTPTPCGISWRVPYQQPGEQPRGGNQRHLRSGYTNGYIAQPEARLAAAVGIVGRSSKSLGLRSLVAESRQRIGRSPRSATAEHFMRYRAGTIIAAYGREMDQAF